MTPGVLDVAAHFATSSPPVTFVTITHGHIHDTYVVTCGSERIVLQRLNAEVFRDLGALAANLEVITTHLRRVAAARGERPIVAEPIPTRGGALLHVDAFDATWRASRFIEGTRVLGPDATTDELRRTARAFAELTRDLDDIEPGALAPTIPRFHDLPRRRADLATAVDTDRAQRAGGALDLIEQAERLGDALEGELARAGAGDLPTRIVHNDAKLDNVLVDAATGAVRCIVDLDTVMPGTLLNDFGELARTATAGCAEDEPDVTKVELDRERFAALAAGYLTGSASFVLDFERECLPLAGPLLALENGVRFLTDHLDGDRYFRVHRVDHNAARARVQLRITEQMLQQLDGLRAVIMAAAA